MSEGIYPEDYEAPNFEGERLCSVIAALRAENERLERYGKNAALALRVQTENFERVNAELAALKAVPDGVEVVGVIDEDDEGCFVELMNDRSFRIGEKLVRQSDHLAALRQPVADEREASVSQSLLSVIESAVHDERVPNMVSQELASVLIEARAALSAPAAGQEPVAWTVAYPPSYRPYMHNLSFISEQDAEAYVDQKTPAEKGCVVVPLYAAPIAPPAEDTGQDVSALVEALGQTRIDLVILRGSFAQAAKYDHKAEGMDDEIGKWIGRIDAALAAHKAGGA